MKNFLKKIPSHYFGVDVTFIILKNGVVKSLKYRTITA